MIVGVDEAGSGPLAGPVVAAAVVLCPDGIVGLDDSKKLSAKRRAGLEAEIKARCRWAVGMATCRGNRRYQHIAGDVARDDPCGRGIGY